MSMKNADCVFVAHFLFNIIYTVFLRRKQINTVQKTAEYNTLHYILSTTKPTFVATVQDKSSSDES